MNRIKLSTLPHTWLIDVDGTLVPHNGYRSTGDVLLPGVEDLWTQIPPDDFVVLLTARQTEDLAPVLALLAASGLRYDAVLTGLPTGERVLINDVKPRGLKTAIAVNVARDEGLAALQVISVPDD